MIFRADLWFWSTSAFSCTERCCSWIAFGIVPYVMQSINHNNGSSVQKNLHPFERLAHPFGRNVQPFERLAHPFDKNVQPFERLAHPFVKNIQPFERLTHPFDKKVQPFERLAHPFVKNIQPFERLAHPFAGTSICSNDFSKTLNGFDHPFRNKNI